MVSRLNCYSLHCTDEKSESGFIRYHWPVSHSLRFIAIKRMRSFPNISDSVFNTVAFPCSWRESKGMVLQNICHYLLFYCHYWDLFSKCCHSFFMHTQRPDIQWCLWNHLFGCFIVCSNSWVHAENLAVDVILGLFISGTWNWTIFFWMQKATVNWLTLGCAKKGFWMEWPPQPSVAHLTILLRRYVFAWC